MQDPGVTIVGHRDGPLRPQGMQPCSDGLRQRGCADCGRQRPVAALHWVLASTAGVESGWNAVEGVDVAERAVLCRVTPDLVAHLVQLLSDAGLSARGEADGEFVRLTVPADQEEHARSVIGLVLPGLLEPEADTVRLSDRLVRSDSEAEPEPEPEPEPGLRLLDGRFALGGGNAAPPAPPVPDHDEFVPPPPPAIPPPRDRISRFAWGGVILGPILLLLSALLSLPSIITAAGLAMFIGGFGTLVGRRDDSPREGWDDGAVV